VEILGEEGGSTAGTVEIDIIIEIDIIKNDLF